MNTSGEDLSAPTVMVGPALRVDAHHHLWHYRAEDLPWIDEAMAPLRRNFLVEDLQLELEEANVDATVVVQARESVAETRWLLECARSAPEIRGVVGWVPLSTDELPKLLDEFLSASQLVGFREVIQAKPDGYLEQAAFNRGIQQLTELGLAYDILIHERQLVEAIHFVDRHPYQRFVLDHAAKPKILSREVEPWKTHIRELAQRPNVSCKISGLATEADWQRWTIDSLRPYLDACVAAFGVERILAGSDWPVCLVASTYSHWWDVLGQYFKDFSVDEIERVFGRNAISFYDLPDTIATTCL